ncbi:MAG: alanine--tRNA ligase [Lactobacillaceae bacterium]|jgi:alanyl-tRNA synthetase|nr:alanine--tRNA ligase [Lactobacillaceae bacterium]
MKELSSVQIRQMWLDFFASKGHEVVPSQSLIPVNDPTLLWINSGVATLKKYFDGTLVPNNPRITNSQKAIRTNDIENVGHTPRHHTLFEMLGNFSIGDYFKKEAITWAWELLTSPEWYDIDPALLYVTVYPNDTEAYDIWRNEVGLPEDHIVKVEDNFWDIGEGPSGPDSEIFFDRGVDFQDLPDDDPEMYPGGENERYLEIWNLVFSQYNHLPGLTDNSQYPELPHKNIDTGAGLERFVSVFQHGRTNFDTDLFLPIIHATENLSDVNYGDNPQTDVSFKVIADHISALTFAIGDGALPSNEGRGYIIRRLIRRSVLHGRKLNIAGSFLGDLVPVVGQIMKDFYPELLDQQEKTVKIVLAEEKRFSETLNEGLQLFEEVAQIAKSQGNQISGSDAFKLYDTYGFPLEITIEQAQDAGLTVDTQGFEIEMEAQRTRARESRSSEKSMKTQSAILTDIKDESEYVGWSELNVDDAHIIRIIKDDAVVESAKPGEIVQVILDVTPFYAEMGGQIADTGFLLVGDKKVAKVIDVQNAPNGQHLHTVEVLEELVLTQAVKAAVDLERHIEISKNHTATHMLDQALRMVLGDDVHQAGSLVTDELLRFDFTYQGPVASEDLKKLEKIINDEIAKNSQISWVETDIESAKKLGAIAVFGEKYGEIVRVVSIGDFNVEFDGGTHAQSTSELQLFKIVSESGIGAGVRRIEAVVGQNALDIYSHQEEILSQLSELLKAQTVDQTTDKLEKLLAENKELQKENESLNAQLINSKLGDVLNDVQELGTTTLTSAIVNVNSMDGLRQIADDWKTKGNSQILVLGAAIDGKANLLVASKDKTFAAGSIIKEIAPVIGGGGGGRPDMAQAGGKNPEGLSEALQKAAEYITKIG